jgi:phosphoribosyl 1,2-cyclic phosphodiesterase
MCLMRSGSSGNCTFLEHNATKVLLDAGGLSKAGIISVLAEIQQSFDGIQAIVVTHLHSDHLGQGVLRLCRERGVPVYVHESNVPPLAAIVKKYNLTGVKVLPFSCKRFSVGDIEFSPFVVDHDAPETTCGFTFWSCDAPHSRVAFATDLGCFPDSLVPHFADSEYVVLESNHDTGLLWNNPHRPMYHKQRVASDTGHLSNEQAATALVKICAASRRLPAAIVLSHLSADHNSPEMAITHVGAALRAKGFAPMLLAAYRDKKTQVFEYGKKKESVGF